MSHCEPIEPYEWHGAWEGRVRFSDGQTIRLHVCGHLHSSAGEAEQCAKSLAAQLNSKLLPSDYYLG
jgi:hypothetical protein